MNNQMQCNKMQGNIMTFGVPFHCNLNHNSETVIPIDFTDMYKLKQITYRTGCKNRNHKVMTYGGVSMVTVNLCQPFTQKLQFKRELPLHKTLRISFLTTPSKITFLNVNTYYM